MKHICAKLWISLIVSLINIGGFAATEGLNANSIQLIGYEAGFFWGKTSSPIRVTMTKDYRGTNWSKFEIEKIEKKDEANIKISLPNTPSEILTGLLNNKESGTVKQTWGSMHSTGEGRSTITIIVKDGVPTSLYYHSRYLVLLTSGINVVDLIKVDTDIEAQ